MHILIVHQVFVTPNEGGGTRHFEIAKYLVKFGHAVTVIASDTDYLSGKKKAMSFEVIDGVNIYYVKTLSSLHKSIFTRGLSFFSFMYSCYKKGISIKGVDLVWGTSPPLFQVLAAYRIAKVNKIPIVCEVRDLWQNQAKDLSLHTQ